MINIDKKHVDYINQLRIDPSLKPNYETIKSCLVWQDEVPECFTGDVREFIYDLLIVRGFIHKSIPKEKWGFDPTYLLAVWDEGLILVPNWPGFKRLILSSEEQNYLNQCLHEDAQASRLHYDL